MYCVYCINTENYTTKMKENRSFLIKVYFLRTMLFFISESSILRFVKTGLEWPKVESNYYCLFTYLCIYPLHENIGIAVTLYTPLICVEDQNRENNEKWPAGRPFQSRNGWSWVLRTGRKRAALLISTGLFKKIK